MQALAKAGPGGQITADAAWKQLQPIREQLDGLLAAATVDQQERQKFQADLTKAGRLVQSFAKLAGSDLSKFKKLFEQAEACAKPGGVLKEGEKILAEINQEIKASFSAEQRQEVLRQGLAKVESRVSKLSGTSANQAQMLLAQARKLAKSNDSFDAAFALLDQLAQLVQLSLAKAVKPTAKEEKKPAPQTASDPYLAKNESNENKLDPYYANKESPQPSQSPTADLKQEKVEKEEEEKTKSEAGNVGSDSNDAEEEKKANERRGDEVSAAYYSTDK